MPKAETAALSLREQQREFTRERLGECARANMAVLPIHLSR
jgi:hypothetical protein